MTMLLNLSNTYCGNFSTTSVKRVDVVFDIYMKHSLKESARKKRSQGIRRRVEGKNMIPHNCPKFLSLNENKTEPFYLIGEHITRGIFLGFVLVTYDENVR